MHTYHTMIYTSRLPGLPQTDTTLLFIDGRLCLMSLALACGYKNLWAQRSRWLRKWPITLQPHHWHDLANPGLARQLELAGLPLAKKVATISLADLRAAWSAPKGILRKPGKLALMHMVAIGQQWKAHTVPAGPTMPPQPAQAATGPVQATLALQNAMALETTEDLLLQQNALLAEAVQLLRKIHHQLMQPPTHQHSHH